MNYACYHHDVEEVPEKSHEETWNFANALSNNPTSSVYLFKRIDKVEHPDASNDMKLRFEFLKQTRGKL